jgi:hypothetical protein
MNGAIFARISDDALFNIDIEILVAICNTRYSTATTANIWAVFI